MIFKIIVYVDGPIKTELSNSLDEFKHHFSNKIKVIVSPTNLGLGHALNVLLSHCDGWTLKLDSDDLLLPGALGQVHQFLSSSSHRVAVFSAPVYCANLDKLDRIYRKDFSTGFFSLRQRFNHSFLLINCSKYIPRYDPSIILREDWDLDMGMRIDGKEVGKLSFIPLMMHVNEDTKQRRKNKIITASEIQILKKIWNARKSSFWLTCVVIQLVRVISLRIRNGL